MHGDETWPQRDGSCSIGPAPGLREELLTRLPNMSPGIVGVQHLPATFTAALAARPDGLCRITVKAAADNRPLHHPPVHPGNGQ